MRTINKKPRSTFTLSSLAQLVFAFAVLFALLQLAPILAVCFVVLVFASLVSVWIASVKLRGLGLEMTSGMKSLVFWLVLSASPYLVIAFFLLAFITATISDFGKALVVMTLCFGGVAGVVMAMWLGVSAAVYVARDPR